MESNNSNNKRYPQLLALKKLRKIISRVQNPQIIYQNPHL